MDRVHMDGVLAIVVMALIKSGKSKDEIIEMFAKAISENYERAKAVVEHMEA